MPHSNGLKKTAVEIPSIKARGQQHANGTCTTRAISELFALDVRSSRWIATISARARRLSRPQSCRADLGMVRTSRMLRGVASCAQVSLHGAPSHTSVGSQSGMQPLQTDLLAGEGTGRRWLRSSRLIRGRSASPGPVSRITHYRVFILVR